MMHMDLILLVLELFNEVGQNTAAPIPWSQPRPPFGNGYVAQPSWFFEIPSPSTASSVLTLRECDGLRRA